MVLVVQLVTLRLQVGQGFRSADVQAQLQEFCVDSGLLAVDGMAVSCHLGPPLAK